MSSDSTPPTEATAPSFARVHEAPILCDDLPGVGGALGPNPEDFVVNEVPEYPLSGDGEHLFVRIKKRCLTTQDAIEAISRAAGVRPPDIGSAGMKDKHAVTTQWLSLPGRASPPETWQLPEGLELCETGKNQKKLRTGQLAGNEFEIRLVGVSGDALDRAEPICERIRREGLPNYFGAQRFGFGGANLPRALSWLAGGDRIRHKRGRFYMKLYPSVVQSEVFNRYLSMRRELGLGRLVTGDVVRLNGTHSVFVVEDPEREQHRLEEGDIHLTGPMPGPKTRRAAGRIAELEARAELEAGLVPELAERLARFVDGTRRDLVVRPGNFRVSLPEPGVLALSFFLPAGSFATQLLRELTRAPFFAAREARREPESDSAPAG